MAAVAGGGALLLWPALINGYPIVFSDTLGLAEMGLEPTMGWDKPWVYGPLILLFHWGVTLWGVAVAQVLAVSWVLWLVARVVGQAAWWRHLGLCAVLAVGSAAPWFADFIMPDIGAPLVVLCLFLLGWGRPALGPVARTAVAVLASLAIACHLAHLLIAAGCLAVVLLVRTRRVLVCAAPLAAALVWLVGSNAVGNGVVGVSPYGSVFALARLQADGPAADYLHSVCPAAGYRLCAWADRLPMDSDEFLWSPDGPIWGGKSGPTRVAPEASRIVSASLRFEPGLAARAAARNTVRQLGMVRLGDVLGPQHLVSTVGLLLLTYFPVAEIQRFEASRQVHGTLMTVAEAVMPLDIPLLLLGLAGTMLAIVTWRRHPALAGLGVIVLAGVLANAFATGALSGPHDRYAARITWLVIVPAWLWLSGSQRVGRRRPPYGP